MNRLGCDTCRCNPKDCSQKESCLRFMDKGEYCYRYSMSDFSGDPVKGDSGECLWKIPIKKD